MQYCGEPRCLACLVAETFFALEAGEPLFSHESAADDAIGHACLGCHVSLRAQTPLLAAWARAYAASGADQLQSRRLLAAGLANPMLPVLLSVVPDDRLAPMDTVFSPPSPLFPREWCVEV